MSEQAEIYVDYGDVMTDSKGQRSSGRGLCGTPMLELAEGQTRLKIKNGSQESWFGLSPDQLQNLIDEREAQFQEIKADMLESASEMQYQRALFLRERMEALFGKTRTWRDVMTQTQTEEQ